MTTDIIGALGAGSGVDVKSLAQSLVDVEKLPRESAINSKIDVAAHAISAFTHFFIFLNECCFLLFTIINYSE